MCVWVGVSVMCVVVGGCGWVAVWVGCMGGVCGSGCVVQLQNCFRKVLLTFWYSIWHGLTQLRFLLSHIWLHLCGYVRITTVQSLTWYTSKIQLYNSVVLQTWKAVV